MDIKKRMKNYGFWIAIIAQVLAILQMIEVLSVSNIEIINNIVTAVLQIFVLLGVINNPTTNQKGFGDD